MSRSASRTRYDRAQVGRSLLTVSGATPHSRNRDSTARLSDLRSLLQSPACCHALQVQPLVSTAPCRETRTRKDPPALQSPAASWTDSKAGARTTSNPKKTFGICRRLKSRCNRPFSLRNNSRPMQCLDLSDPRQERVSIPRTSRRTVEENMGVSHSPDQVIGNPPQSPTSSSNRPAKIRTKQTLTRTRTMPCGSLIPT